MEESKEQKRNFRGELIEQFITLSTSGFGFVAALAWNDAIQAFFKQFVERFFPEDARVISKFIYAIIITFFAVFITYQLSKLASRWGIKK